MNFVHIAPIHAVSLVGISVWLTAKLSTAMSEIRKMNEFDQRDSHVNWQGVELRNVYPSISIYLSILIYFLILLYPTAYATIIYTFVLRHSYLIYVYIPTVVLHVTRTTTNEWKKETCACGCVQLCYRRTLFRIAWIELIDSPFNNLKSVFNV